jgi:hypothetical protein|tara:strand:+ start:750 stop:1430 length:681 start_codon:yes stop_codon:yes gene_type:complete
MKNYIRDKQELRKGNFVTHSAINVIVKDELMFDLEMEDLEKILNLFPKSVTRRIDYIIFGNFNFLNKFNYNAAYNEGAIYVSNIQGDNMDILDDIVHEIGHSVEDNNKELVYGDGLLEMEFINKRNLLNKELKKSGYNIPDEKMQNPDYDKQLDLIFSDKIGYPEMTAISQGIFYSPYGATSLKEYFANGFEAYYYHKDLYLKKVSPVLFAKIEMLEEMENEASNI